MMVTVAKSLDVPIKLVFPRPPPADDPTAQSGHAMLGLGDVVLPGIMIGLALRFDLFLFYLRRQTRTKDLSGGEEDSVVEKPKYHSLAGKWSDHFWTHSLLTGRPLFKNADNDDEKEKEKSSSPFTFPKTYFKASLVGYIAGMLCTLAIMHVWGHAQPALLYLVPGVLASLWLTALARGELRLMWTFTEAAEEEEEEAQRQKKGETESSPSDSNRKEPKGKTATRESFFSLSDKKAGEREERARNALGKHVRFEDGGDSASDDEDGDGDKKEKEKEDKAKRNVKRAAGHQSKKEVFSFSIEAPWRLKSPRSVAKGEKVVLRDGLLVKEKDAEEGKEESGTVEPPVKRVRLN
jgi:minor histocompatibility antigen H13